MIVLNKLPKYIVYIKKSVPTPIVEFIQNVYHRCINGIWSGLDKKHYTGCSYGLLVCSRREQCIIYDSYVNYRYISYNDLDRRYATKYLCISIPDKHHITYRYEFDQQLNIIKWIVSHKNYTSEKITAKNYIKTTIKKHLRGERYQIDSDQCIEYNYINQKIKYVKNTISNYGVNVLNIVMIAKYKKGKIFTIKIRTLNDLLDPIKIEKYILSK